jgi:hypothetical protein
MISRIARIGVAVAAAITLVCAAPALAGPVTVNLRVEGAAGTLYEGPITTDARMITAPDTSSPPVVGPHPCDFKDNGSNGGFGPSLGTPTTALYDAVGAANFTATWYASLSDFFITSIGTDTGGSGWGLAFDYSTSSVGGCQIGLGAGDDVLWASDYYSKSHLLRLTGAATAVAGQPLGVHVVDGGSGAAFAGATVGSAATDTSGNPQTTYAPATDGSGNASVTFSAPGTFSLKAFHNSDSVRSNRLDVCVHNANDGLCGNPVSAPAGGSASSPGGGAPGGGPSPVGSTKIVYVVARPLSGRLRGIRDGRHFRRRRGPREIRGIVTPDPSGLRQIRLRLSRRHGDRCAGFDGASERFRPTPCGARQAPWFSVGNQPRFSYLLPFRLPTGRYVMDLVAVDRRGHRDSGLQRGRNRIVFWVG